MAKATHSSDPAGGHHRAHGGSRAHNPAQPSGVGEPVSSALSRDIHPAQRIWLQEDGVRMFGPGTHELLRLVDDSGSLNQAAKDMGMSYSKAWRIVREVEHRLGVVLFERQTGGPGGGGSRLTDQGRLLLLRFDAFSREASEALEELFERHFGDLFPGAHDAATGKPAPPVGPSSE